jgi:YesN/AraC family two-component response regulator
MRLYEPDVVITDIEMPGISGIELINLVRLVRPGTPVVVMTAHASADYAIEALRNNADEFLTKPIASADLISVVSRLAEEFRAAKDHVEPEVGAGDRRPPRATSRSASAGSWQRTRLRVTTSTC